MTETTDFLRKLSPLGLTSAERAIALLWWHSREDPLYSVSATHLAREIEAAGYPAQNASRVRDALSKDRRTIRAQGGSFRIRVDARAALDDRYLDCVPGRAARALVAPANEDVLKAESRAGRAMAALQPTMGPPRVFIGSSVEGLAVAEALQEGLDHDAEVTLWSQGVFGLSSGTLETLADIASGFDFALLVLTPDDLLEKRGSARPSARDNVLFELGLFVGALGRRRTFVVHPRDVDMHLPSDLAGVTTATYAASRSDGSLIAALGPVCTKTKREFREQGRRPLR